MRLEGVDRLFFDGGKGQMDDVCVICDSVTDSLMWSWLDFRREDAMYNLGV